MAGARGQFAVDRDQVLHRRDLRRQDDPVGDESKFHRALSAVQAVSAPGVRAALLRGLRFGPLAVASMSRASSPGPAPQFTPIRTAFPVTAANFDQFGKLWFRACVPTADVAGLIRYFASALGAAGWP